MQFLKSVFLAFLGTFCIVQPYAQGTNPKLPPMNIAELGSFHIGGRFAEVSGKEVKEVVFTPGGAPAKIDPNGN